MKIFTIENETNNITVHATIQDAEAVANAERFRNEAGLNKLAADWPAARLVEIWNSLPGAIPVKKFKDRQTAVSRIWKALQSLGQAAPAADEQPPAAEALRSGSHETTEPVRYSGRAEPATATPVAPQTPDVAPEEAPATKKATARKSAPKAAKCRRPRRPAKAARPPRWSRCSSARKAPRCPRSWRRWVGRNTRSAGSWPGAMKKAGFTVESFKPEGGERTYRINQ